MALEIMKRMPPASEEMEKAALAAALLSQDALNMLLEFVAPEDMYYRTNRDLYTQMAKLHRENNPVDLVTLMANTSDNDVKALALELFDATPSAGGIKHYCEQITGLSLRRKAIAVMLDGLDKLFNIEEKEPVHEIQTKVLSLIKPKANESRALSDLVDDAYARTWEAYQRQQAGERTTSAHVQSGIDPLDELLTMKRGDMIVVGARPSAGKTSIGVQIALHAARERPLLFFSLEEPSTQIADRYLTAMTGISMRRIQEGRLSQEEMDRVADAQASVEYCRMVVNDTPGLRVSDMRAIALRLQAQRGEEWGAIMIDHMVKVKGENPTSTGHQKLTQVSQDIKNMARALRIPVIVLTQLRRPMDEAAEPNMSDLRESGSIEEDADSILLIHRPERDKMFSSAKLLLKKQRTGPCGSLEMLFEAEKMRFVKVPALPSKGFGVL